MKNDIKDSIVVFLDILGFKKLIKNEKDSENLLCVIKNIKTQNTDTSKIEISNKYSSHLMRAMPAITSFSDCIVLSIPIGDLEPPFDIGHAVNALLDLTQQLADSLIMGGYILRGGMTRGRLYHEDGVVFGPALIEAYDLEHTKAKNPRILVSDELTKNYNDSKCNECNFLSKEANSVGKDEYYLDYLRYSFQNHESKNKYTEVATHTVVEKQRVILEKIHNKDFFQIEEEIKILKKWIYFINYIKKNK
jgi:hypothetical protein